MSLAQALAHFRTGGLQRAASLVRAHLEREHNDPKGWFLLGACQHALKDLPAAAAAFSRTIELQPANLEAHLAYALVLRESGDVSDALAAYERALVHLPHEARLHHAMALSLEDLGRTEAALNRYERALEVQPGFEDSLHNRGLLLVRVGRLQDAELNFRNYVDAHPRSLRARGSLADILLAQGRYEEVIRTLDSITSASIDDAANAVRRGLAFACLRRLNEARETFAHTRARYPDEVLAFVSRIAPGADIDAVLSPENIFLSRRYMALGQCDWSGWDDYVAEMRRAARTPQVVLEPALAFMAQHLPLSGAERHDIARRIASRIEGQTKPLPPPASRAPSRIRVGILSPDYREHLNAYLLLPLFELADRGRFELYAYSVAADDDSQARARIRAAADCFRDLHAMTNTDAAMAIRKDDVDILIDAAGHTTGGRFAIMAQRPARAHALYLGFSGSLASNRVDYAIVDRIIASQDTEWTESLVYLPHTWFLYDFRTRPSDTSVSRNEYGLPNDSFVYCAFHRAEKISPDVFDLWMAILGQVPSSVLWFLDLPDAARRNLRHQAGTRGIDPSRLVFAPYEPRSDARYLARQRLGDLFLDALHHNAMTTACDALGGGLPMLTLRGSTFTSRGGESLVRAAGLEELVAPNRDAYVREAVELAGDRNRLAACRRTLDARTGPLFDTVQRVRELEEALEQIWHNHAR